MLSLIGTTIKNAGLILLVLVSSHIIQIRGVSISNHVENALDAIVNFSPTQEIKRASQEVGGMIRYGVDGALPKAEGIKKFTTRSLPDAEFTAQDQKQLQHVITKSRASR